MFRTRKAHPPPVVPRPAGSPALDEYLPTAGKVVSVGFEDVSRSWRTRVEQAGNGSLVLVAPTRALGEAIVPEDGRPVILGWAESDGYFEAESTFRASGVDTVVTWTLDVQKIARLQRRSAFRIETSGDVMVQVDQAPVAGRLRNISEGGLACALPTSGEPDPDAEVVVSTELQGLGRVEVPGKVVRVAPSTEAGKVEIGIAFTQLEADVAESLRQFVFEEQLRRRRALSGR